MHIIGLVSYWMTFKIASNKVANKVVLTLLKCIHSLVKHLSKQGRILIIYERNNSSKVIIMLFNVVTLRNVSAKYFFL